jgi:G3E family GTPase
MRTPVVLVAGQGDTEATVRALLDERTLVVRHRFDGHVVRRSLAQLRDGVPYTSYVILELRRGCVSCTIRDDLLILLRRLHRRSDMDRVVVHLAAWMEPEPICWAINRVPVSPGPGYVDGPAGRDVRIAGVVTCLDGPHWLEQAIGGGELDDGRTEAQVVVGQAEFADVVVAAHADHTTMAALVRLNPRAWFVRSADHVEHALAGLGQDARRGRQDDPLGPLLDGEPPLEADGPVRIVEFSADRPFHPSRLHSVLDVLLAGVVRARGRLWLASRPDQVMCLESAGGGLRVDSGGKWLAAMSESELARSDPQRRALAAAIWDGLHGDRHTAITVLTCGASAEEITESLNSALLTDLEWADPAGWCDVDDPFGDWHQEPCAESSDSTAGFRAPNTDRGDEG